MHAILVSLLNVKKYIYDEHNFSYSKYCLTMIILMNLMTHGLYFLTKFLLKYICDSLLKTRHEITIFNSAITTCDQHLKHPIDTYLASKLEALVISFHWSEINH